MQAIRVKEKVKVFISSNIGEKYAYIREALKLLLTETNMCEVCHEMDGCSVQVMMMPEAYAKKADSSGILLAQERSYAKSDSIISNRKICIRFVPIVDRLFEDISKAKDRTVEAVFFMELMQCHKI